jgi:hypothetical protein
VIRMTTGFAALRNACIMVLGHSPRGENSPES